MPHTTYSTGVTVSVLIRNQFANPRAAAHAPHISHLLYCVVFPPSPFVILHDENTRKVATVRDSLFHLLVYIIYIIRLANEYFFTQNVKMFEHYI